VALEILGPTLATKWGSGGFWGRWLGVRFGFLALLAALALRTTWSWAGRASWAGLWLVGFSLTEVWQRCFLDEAQRLLSRPGHPRNDVDLGIYALQQLSPEVAQRCIGVAVEHLYSRRAFLQERLEWCRARDLFLPALAFERPLLALDADIAWLQRVARALRSRPELLRGPGWGRYEYLEPPDPSA
jgi:hypothetical protein